MREEREREREGKGERGRGRGRETEKEREREKRREKREREKERVLASSGAATMRYAAVLSLSLALVWSSVAARPILRTPRVYASVRAPPPPPLSSLSPASTEALMLGQQRAAALCGGGAATLAASLPGAPDFWLPAAHAELLPAAPLLTLGAMFALVLAGWAAFGTEMHPITAKARGLPPPPGYAFHILGLSAVVLSAGSIALSWYPLPFAACSPGGSIALELVHCLVPIAIWQMDAWLIRFLNPHVEWEEGATSLPTNYMVEHGNSLIGAALALLGVIWFEVYVQQMLAAPLTLAGWPLLGSASLIALNAGLVHSSPSACGPCAMCICVSKSSVRASPRVDIKRVRTRPSLD